MMLGIYSPAVTMNRQEKKKTLISSDIRTPSVQSNTTHLREGDATKNIARLRPVLCACAQTGAKRAGLARATHVFSGPARTLHCTYSIKGC